MNAIYNGRCHFVVSREGDAVWLEETHSERARRTLVSVGHPDLILNPSEEDLDLAQAFERGEVNAFEYPSAYRTVQRDRCPASSGQFIRQSALTS
jgi:hypothetical protein